MTQNETTTRINQSPGAAEPEPELRPFLVSLGACAEAVKVHGHQTLAEAWRTCARGDWMLWLCAKQVGEPGWPTRRQLVLAACACADFAFHAGAAYAVCAAAAAIHSAAAAYADAAYRAANRKAFSACADICRKMLPTPSRAKSK